MDVVVAVLITMHVVSSAIGQTTPPMTYVTGPNVCVTNVTFQETRQVTYLSTIKYYARCKWNRRCAKYRIQLNSKYIVSDAWRFETRCCDGFVRSGDRCEKGREVRDWTSQIKERKLLADKVQLPDDGSDVTDYSIWPPIIGTLMAIFAITTVVVIIVLKRKSSAKRNGTSSVEVRAIANQTYGDAVPSVSHSYETLDDSPVTKSRTYEKLDTSRVGMTQNIYDSINTYTVLQSGSKR